MDLTVYIQLIFLCVVNIIFTFSGIVSNTLVIASIWKSSQLRKKLCHFMTMVLSCFDLVAVVTNHPGILLYLISWLRKDYDLQKTTIYLNISGVFLVLSLLALLVMNIERYLGAYYPIFHHTSVTRRKLITLLVILLIPSAVVYMISRYGVISYRMFFIIFMVLFVPPFIFVNFKLFAIARKLHRERAIAPEKRTAANFKNISTALWAVACLILLFFPHSLNIAFIRTEKSESTIDLSYIWTFTCVTMIVHLTV